MGGVLGFTTLTYINHNHSDAVAQGTSIGLTHDPAGNCSEAR